jgi:flagellar biosynthesis protein FlhG
MDSPMNNSEKLIEASRIAAKQSAGSQSNLKQVWAVGGGKGGVGKTLISANFAITLARAGAKVIAIDLDLGGANLHTCLGVESSRRTLSDLFDPNTKDLSELAVPTSIPNLSLISGSQDNLNIANLPHAQKTKLINRLRQLPCDYLILDLGAGTSFNTLDFFISADVGILTVLPEPTSIENAYRFIKSIFYRKLKSLEQLYEARSYIDATMNRKNELGIRTPADLVRTLEALYPDVGSQVRLAMGKFETKLILNQVRTEADTEIGFGVRNVCKKYFGLNVDYLGHLEYDSAVWQSVRRRRPLAVEFPSSPIMPMIQRMVGTLVAEQAEKLKRLQSNA